MSPVLRGAAQGQVCPGRLSPPAKEKVSPEMVSREELGLWEVLWAHCHRSPHSHLCPRPEAPELSAHVGSSTSPRPGPRPSPSSRTQERQLKRTARPWQLRPAGPPPGPPRHPIPCCTRG